MTSTDPLECMGYYKKAQLRILIMYVTKKWQNYFILKMSCAIYIPSGETSSDDDFYGDLYKETKEFVSNGLTGNHLLFQ